MLVGYTLILPVAYLLSSIVLRPQWDSMQIHELDLGQYKDICPDILFIFKDAIWSSFAVSCCLPYLLIFSLCGFLSCSGMFEDNTFVYMIEPLELIHDEVSLWP